MAFPPGKLHHRIYRFEYWATERDRLSLRRVCSTWNRFLTKYDHRFVQVRDVLHGLVPLSAIPSAVRLNVNPCDVSCRRCNTEREIILGRITEFEQTKWDPFSFRQPTIASEGGEWFLVMRCLEEASLISSSWSTQILEGDLITPVMMRAVKSSTIGCILSSRIERNFIIKFLSISGVYEWVYPRHFIDTFMYNSSVGDFISEKLTTLSCHVSSLRSVTFWSLPNLRYLRISGMYPPFPIGDQEHLVHLLQGIGPTLTTFLHRDHISPLSLPTGIWTWFPRLECIQTPFAWTAPPPIGHPLAYVQFEPRLTNWLPDIRARLDSHLPFALLRNSRVHTLRLEGLWCQMFTSRFSQPTAKCILEHAARFDIRVADEEDVSLHNYIAFLIQFHWKGGRATTTVPRRQTKVERV
ncbi:hypothetical protein FRC17_005723 [Serendipita sp. 399]|nr:hypothetical protein FRC17_005723 [Serendipita sp. 399]